MGDSPYKIAVHNVRKQAIPVPVVSSSLPVQGKVQGSAYPISPPVLTLEPRDRSVLPDAFRPPQSDMETPRPPLNPDSAIYIPRVVASTGDTTNEDSRYKDTTQTTVPTDKPENSKYPPI